MAALADPRVQSPQELETLQAATRVRGVELSIYPVTSADSILPAINTAKSAGAGGLNVLAASLFGGNVKMIIAQTAALRLPAIYQWPEIADDGGLLAYGPRITQIYRQLARQLVKLMRDVKPADIPVEQPTVFELVVNLKTAQAMGLDLPATFLTRADEVIE